MGHIVLRKTKCGWCAKSCMLNCRRDNVCRAGWHCIQEDTAASIPGPACPLYREINRTTYFVVETY